MEVTLADALLISRRVKMLSDYYNYAEKAKYRESLLKHIEILLRYELGLLEDELQEQVDIQNENKS